MKKGVQIYKENTSAIKIGTSKIAPTSTLGGGCSATALYQRLRPALREKSTTAAQPVDAGYAALVKVHMSRLQDQWMDVDDNLDKWISGEMCAGDRRVLLTHWLADAVDAVHKLTPLKLDAKTHRWRCFEKTGCLMTADGSGDGNIKPQGIQGS